MRIERSMLSNNLIMSFLHSNLMKIERHWRLDHAG